jgi:hypothetical protein
LGIGLGAVLVVVQIALDLIGQFVIEGKLIEWPQINLPLEQIPAMIMFTMFIALTEELLIRGYPLQSLIRSFGLVPGVIATSLLFGALHITGDFWNSAVVVLDTAFAGAIFAMCYFKTKALWMPIGVHLANNAVVFLISGPDLTAINFIPPELSKDVFLFWWWVNFPLYVIVLIFISRWRYQPDSVMQNYYHTYVSPAVAVDSTVDSNDPVDIVDKPWQDEDQ